MTNVTRIKTPAESIAEARKAEYDLTNHGIANPRVVYWNLPAEAIHEEAVFRGEGETASGGPLIVNTGRHKGRSANDKFLVKHVDSESHVWWGQYNRPFAAEKFHALHERMLGFMQGKDLFVQDVFAGAD